MAVPRLYLDGTEIYFTVRDTYELEVNPQNGRRQWSMEIFAGPSIMKPGQYTEIAPLLTASPHTFIAEDGSSYQVRVENNWRVVSLLSGHPIISVTLTEPGFNDEKAGGSDIEITGTFAGYSFTAKLSDYSCPTQLFGQMTRSLAGTLKKSVFFSEYLEHTLSLPWISGFDTLRHGAQYSFNFSYADTDGVYRTVAGSGLLTQNSRSGDKITVTLTQDGLR